MFSLNMSSEKVGGSLIYKSNHESMFNKAGIGSSKPVVRQEALAL